MTFSGDTKPDGLYKNQEINLVNGITDIPMQSQEIHLHSEDVSISQKEPPPTVKRDQWKNKVDFLLACVGFSVGFGNVWRFPYLCYKNGGGAFLLPYFISVLCGGIPLFFLEVVLGQFTSQGGIEAWQICPIFKGIGFAGAVIVFCLNCYYNVILAWALHYLFSSFTSVLPWTKCDMWWNTARCHLNVSGILANTSTVAPDDNGVWKSAVDPVTEYWENRVLGISNDISTVGTIKWDLALCLALAWIIVFLCIIKGIKTSGKVMYVTATCPYILMFILLIKSCTLEGAGEGLKYYLTPNWTRIAEPEVWSDAGTQIFFSYSISLGTLTALGSFNTFHHNSVRDCIAYAVINSLTSLLAGCVIFATLGYMSATTGLSIDEVAESGPGLAFVVYPKALGTMPISPLWSILFFIMLLLLGLDSQFVGVEGFVTAISDIFPSFFNRRSRKICLVGVTCLLCFFVGLTMVTNGGIYVFQLFDYYTGSRIILLVALFECLAVGYVYGARNFTRNMELMYGYAFKYIPEFFWMFVSPVFTLILFVISAYVYKELTYERGSRIHIYRFPQWSVILGWGLASLSILCIPIVAIYEISKAKGNLLERIKYASKPRFSKEVLRRLGQNNACDDYWEVNPPTYANAVVKKPPAYTDSELKETYYPFSAEAVDDTSNTPTTHL